MAEREGFGYPRFPQVTLKLTDSDNSPYSCGFQAPCFSGSCFNRRVVVSIVPRKKSVSSVTRSHRREELSNTQRVHERLTNAFADANL